MLLSRELSLQTEESLDVHSIWKQRVRRGKIIDLKIKAFSVSTENSVKGHGVVLLYNALSDWIY